MWKKIIFLIVSITIIVVAVGLIMKNSKEKTKESNTENSKSNTAFSVKYRGEEIVPGTEFSVNKIDEEANISEIPSCAFDGIDKIYTYKNFEIIVASVNGKDTIYSVYFDNDEMETTEGVKVTDTKDHMIEKYGTDYEQKLGNKYIYLNGNVELSFIIESDIITAIEYTLVTE
jgi:hypothetical protein